MNNFIKKSILKILLAFMFIVPISLNAQLYENFGDMWGIRTLGAGKNIFRGSLGGSMSRISYEFVEDSIITYPRTSINFDLDINPFEDFHIRTQFYFDLTKSDKQPPWLSNLYFQIGQYNWRKYTFSYGYENYSPNRWDGSFNFFTNLKRGFFFASYNVDLIDRFSPLHIDYSSRMLFVPFVRVYPEYPDAKGVETAGYGKIDVGTSFRYTILQNLYVEGAVHFYPIKDTVLPWDPDFTYGFGLFNWEAFTVNITYGNWIGNRFPWNEKELKQHGFLNGQFKLFVNWAW